jgi:nucleoside-diphosphate-sugar epimerase
MDILITGATGFIGSAVCRRLASENNVVGIYHHKKPVKPANMVWEKADLTNNRLIAAICEKYSPEVVIHCAGVSHRKIGMLNDSSYMRVNSGATANLAKAASKSNPGVHFIFLSSVSVYGEDSQITQRTPIKINNNNEVDIKIDYKPSSDYARSKRDAEKRLIALTGDGILRGLIILRLAPVYDRKWTFNLDRRVLAPLNMAYIRFGSGRQTISILARPNLVDFIEFLIRRLHRFPEIDIFNVCDIEAYEFNKVIQILRNSSIRPRRPVIPVSLSLMWFATRIAGGLFPDKRRWLHACYNKLASSQVFNNEKMLMTGFKPCHSLKTIFDPRITQFYAD